jgi:hypothetical protein
VWKQASSKKEDPNEDLARSLNVWFNEQISTLSNMLFLREHKKTHTKIFPHILQEVHFRAPLKPRLEM